MPLLDRRLLLGAAGFGLLARLPAARAQSRNVIDTLAGDSRFNRFVELVGRAGTTDQFRSAAMVTVFAPTASAFNQASAALINNLLAQGSGGGGEQGGGGTLSGASPDLLRLRALIGYHVISGVALTPAEMQGDNTFKTVAGGVVRIASQNGVIALTNPAPEQQSGTFGAGGLNVGAPAVIDGPGIPATNGVIYPITQLLYP